ncbi:isoleucine--tRNA ligase [Psychrobacillus sp. FSL W7-1493]|uniref:isoleucine--tRNA ligase n=1 Tax=Psychrobacillus sp. FSL W7-1493 TaxID=2921552 RepID=UPI0030FB8F54
MVNKDVKKTVIQREQQIRKMWEEHNVFQASIEQRDGNPTFVFYEGPPTANGMPHVGHALGRTIKDLVARYKTMKGYQVIRKAGWDTHGLPVELGVEKQLGISGKKDIEDYGVEAFIKKCKESVFVYEKEWRDFTEKLGYWVDMDSPYMTMSNSYIESVWNILGTIHDQGLLQKGHRVSPYCPSCQTTLSSHEVSQGYKTVKDLSAIVKFKLTHKENEYFLGWTTTPWTLPANVALAVNPSLEYVRAKKGQEVYILAKDLVKKVLKAGYEILSTLKGAELEGLSYTPLFDLVHVKKGYKVVTANYVSSDSGTGIVHIAPAYGEEDYKVMKENSLPFTHVVDERGRFTIAVEGLEGRFVKECDLEIIRLLSHKGLLFYKEKYEHSYPFCWRCDSPLLYYAMESWFIQTTALKEQFLANNESVSWHPEHLKHGRFGNFLEQMVDWNISRNRYWGTPLNVWECSNCKLEIAPKSIEELSKYSLHPLGSIELHKPYVDDVRLCCPSCAGAMMRTPEVIDVWFDSGSMPFAQYHSPFENDKLFSKQFPADLIVEGIDQTRGWFYSLLAVSTLFTGKSPYKRVLSTGHILDENGQKMSKSKGNALDPVELIQYYGADSLRWALLVDSAPWNAKRFSERIVQEAKSKLVDTLDNVYHFYRLYTSLDKYVVTGDKALQQTTLDKWILSCLHSTIRNVNIKLDEFNFTSAARDIARLVEQISNWYIRRSRERFWSSGLNNDKVAAYETLYEVLTKVSQLLAPFTPFIVEEIYVALTGKSVHLTDYPQSDESLIDQLLEQEMGEVLQVVELGRSIRNSLAIKVKQPLAQLFVMSSKPLNWNAYESIIMEELNIKEIHLLNSREEYFTSTVRLDFKKSAAKFGKQSNSINMRLNNLTSSQVSELIQNRSIKLEENLVLLEDVLIEKKVKDGFAYGTSNDMTVLINVTLTEALIHEGWMRELIRAIQSYRKQLLLPVEKRVNISLHTTPEMLAVINNFYPLLEQSVLINQLIVKQQRVSGINVTIGGHEIEIALE